MTQQTLERPTTEQAPAKDAKDDAYWKIAAQWPALTAQDRCDAPTWVKVNGNKTRVSCGAQAFIRVVLPSLSQDLLFCGHHLGEQTVGKDASKSEAAKQASDRQVLEALGAVFLSTYDTINIKPSPSD